MRDPFRYFNSSPEAIRLAITNYVRYPLSLRQVEDLLFERGIDICHNAPKALRVYRSSQKHGVHGQIKKELRRRAAVEPVIGHLKSEGRLDRNYLKGRNGDHAIAVLTATGRNLRCILRWLKDLLCKIIAALINAILPV